MQYIAIESGGDKKEWATLRRELRIEALRKNRARMSGIIAQLPPSTRPRFSSEWSLLQCTHAGCEPRSLQGPLCLENSIYSVLARALAARELRGIDEVPYLFRRLLDLEAAGFRLPPLIYRPTTRDARKDDEQSSWSNLINHFYRRIGAALDRRGQFMELSHFSKGVASSCQEWGASALATPSLGARELATALNYDAARLAEYSHEECGIHLAAAALAQVVAEYDHERNAIRDEISRYRQTSKPYLVKQFGKGLCIRLTKYGPGTVTICVGAFPVLCVKYEESPFSDVTVSVGTERLPLRVQQRALVESRFGASMLFKDRAALRKLVQSDFSNCEELVYVDPYHYIGDSILGLHFVDSFKASFPTVRRVAVFSRSHDHLGHFFESRPYNLEEICRAIKLHKFCVLADLFEHSFDNLVRLLEMLKGAEFSLALLGRNMFVRGEKGGFTLFRSTQSDPLLENMNIENYMEKVVEPFVPAQPVVEVPATPSAKTFWLNPFGSRIEKTVPLRLVVAIARKLAEKGHQLHIIGGLRDSKWHRLWISRLITLAPSLSGGDRNIQIAYFDNLTTMARTLERATGGSFVFTADTSITHLANRCRVPNITFYNSKLWDSASPLSMALDSPLGFSRYYPSHLPVIVNNTSHENVDRIAAQAVDAAMFLSGNVGAEKDRFARKTGSVEVSRELRGFLPSWTDELCSASQLTKDLPQSQETAYLHRAAEQISPRKKFLARGMAA